MPYGIYLSADGAQAQATRMEVITNNLANVDTVGFKRDLAIFQARYAEETEAGLDFSGSGSINDVGGGVQVQETRTDFSSGPIRRTNIPTDVAIEGDGFFQVQKGEDIFLTRAGNFHITASGNLVTQQGYSVLNESGSPISIANQIPWDVSHTGVIRQGGVNQPLALVQPESLGDLVKVGENLFKPLAEPPALPANQRRTLHRHLEMSGVRPTTEMLEMIQASRAFEANVNMIRAQDEMLSGLTTRVLR